MLWYDPYRSINMKLPRLTKKERKEAMQAAVRRRRWIKWRNQEPPRWRIFSWIRWRINEPKEW